MDTHRLLRLIEYRRDRERMARRALIDSQSKLAEVRRWRQAREKRRHEHQASIASWRNGTSEKLLRRYDQLRKLDAEVAELEALESQAEALVEVRLEELVAARREVRSLELLETREANRRERAEEHRTQRILDAFALRKNAGESR